MKTIFHGTRKHFPDHAYVRVYFDGDQPYYAWFRTAEDRNQAEDDKREDYVRWGTTYLDTAYNLNIRRKDLEPEARVKSRPYLQRHLTRDQYNAHVIAHDRHLKQQREDAAEHEHMVWSQAYWNRVEGHFDHINRRAEWLRARLFGYAHA